MPSEVVKEIYSSPGRAPGALFSSAAINAGAGVVKRYMRAINKKYFSRMKEIISGKAGMSRT